MHGTTVKRKILLKCGVTLKFVAS